MYQTILIIVVFVFSAPLALANQRLWGWCVKANSLVVGGLGAQPPSSKWMEVFPSCTVTVYVTGTLPLQLATLSSDNLGTSLPNPFTADQNGFWSFYPPNGRYDIRLSNGGNPSPYTLGDVIANDNIGPVPIPSASPTPLLLQTNGVNNGSQVRLNLTAGSGITFVDDKAGTITANSTATGGSGGLSGTSFYNSQGGSEVDLALSDLNKLVIITFVDIGSFMRKRRMIEPAAFSSKPQSGNGAIPVVLPTGMLADAVLEISNQASEFGGAVDLVVSPGDPVQSIDAGEKATDSRGRFFIASGKGTLFFYNFLTNSWNTPETLDLQPPYDGMVLRIQNPGPSSINLGTLAVYNGSGNSTVELFGNASVPTTHGTSFIVGVRNSGTGTVSVTTHFDGVSFLGTINETTTLKCQANQSALLYSDDDTNWFSVGTCGQTIPSGIMLQSAALIPAGTSMVTVPSPQGIGVGGQSDFGNSAVALQLDASLSGSSIAVGLTCDPTPRMLVITARTQTTGTNLVIQASPAPDSNSTMPICFTMQWPARPPDAP